MMRTYINVQTWLTKEKKRKKQTIGKDNKFDDQHFGYIYEENKR